MAVEARVQFKTAAGRPVTSVGLGGEGILRSTGRGPHARKVIRQAVERGITYFDSAPAYQDSELYLGSFWRENPGGRQNIFQAGKSAKRDKKGALAELEQTLQRLHIDYLDLWQIHDLRTDRDFAALSGPGGGLEAFIAAKKSGKVRYIGVTGHHDPAILTQAVREWPIDSVMLPVNPVEELLGGFLTETLAEAHNRRIGVIGMKILGASHYILPKLKISAALLVRYALTQGITVGIVGCATPDEVDTLAAAGSSGSITGQDRAHLLESFKPYARRLAFYRGVL